MPWVEVECSTRARFAVCCADPERFSCSLATYKMIDVIVPELGGCVALTSMKMRESSRFDAPAIYRIASFSRRNLKFELRRAEQQEPGSRRGCSARPGEIRKKPKAVRLRFLALIAIAGVVPGLIGLEELHS